ncbi:MAG: rhomboid family intramembrane serine protease [Kordia sp.]|nr:MAG: rhomboid family intramembrane serine protease [Kordia sp.]
MTKKELLHKYKTLNVAEKLIAINLVVFVLFGLTTFLFKTNFLFDWFVLSKEGADLINKPWSIMTYSFLHQGLLHFAMNMVMLYYVSKLFFSRFSEKLFLNIYLIGALAGGALFLLSYNLFPVFNNQISFLVGASASVMAVLIFICASLPQMEVAVFTFKVKLWQLGAFFVVLDLVQIPIGNSGGHIAHLGGALLGYLYATQLKKGNDIGKGFGKLIDTIASWFSSRNKSKLKTVHKTKSERRTSDKTVHQKKRLKQEQIDSILDKISKSGYESLSKEEKAFLFQSGKE